MSPPRFALRFPAIVIAVVAVSVAWGVVVFFTAPRSDDPAYTVRTCTIATLWPGQTAEKVE